ncbi:methyltransferase [Millisia brevis]|uniref:methyltransferase n=1 Tax=Millisia brevis TaxID=264148 RepID=UPI00082E91DF|nr:methyltransferase [Millisia brevis]
MSTDATRWHDNPTDPVRVRRREAGKLLGADLDRLGGYTPALGQLLLDGDPVAAATLGGALRPETIAAAVAADLFDEFEADNVTYVRCTATIAPTTVSEDTGWIAFDPEWDDRDDRVPGPGNASDTLLGALAVDEARTAADIGTGCGYVALHLSAIAPRVIATDINPRALAYAELTAALNGQEWDLRLGSYLEPLHGADVELIVANPAFVVGNPDAPSTFRDGDADLSARLVAAMVEVLPPGGVGQFLGNWLYRHDTDRPAEAAAAAAGENDCLVVERAIVEPARYVELWVDPDDPVFARWVDALARVPVVAIGTGIVTVFRGGGTPRRGVARLLDADDEALGPAIAEWIDDAASDPATPAD